MGEEEAAFRRELVEINLRRIPLLLLLSMALTVWTIASLWQDPALGWLRRLLVVDLLSAAGFLAVNPWLRRLPPQSALRPAYVWITAVLALAYMDGYFVLVGQAFGANPVYILGAVTAATVFLLPPTLFLPLLLVNHLAFCALLRVAAPDGVQLLPVLIQNTAGAGVAGLVSVLLFQARREEFGQRRRLAAANALLEKRNRQLNDLMAITAHDLRSPLLGLRDLMALADRAPAAASDMMRQAASTCGEMLALVNRLLDAHAAEARVEAGPMLVTCDLREVVAAAVERAGPRAGARDIAVRAEQPTGPVPVHVDPAGLGQVLDNLIANAVKFSPDGGSVRVRISGQDVEIEDEGPGIAPQDLPGLFQKFHRGAPPKSGEAGSGLGLYIAATFMEAMGGRIAYEPACPHGARFRLSFGPSSGPAAAMERQ